MSAQSKQSVDSLIHAKWVIPVDPADSVLADHAIAISGDRIIDILPSLEAGERYHASNHFELNEHALIPGLINAHGHAAMSLMRGLADDLPLMEWLNQHIWPTEQRLVCDEFVAVGTEYAGLTMPSPSAATALLIFCPASKQPNATMPATTSSLTSTH